jgi:hypothetical protein
MSSSGRLGVAVWVVKMVGASSDAEPRREAHLNPY